MRDEVRCCVGDVEAEGEAIVARARFPAELPVFRGHFPGRPLVPGVFLVEAARAACERALGAPLELTELREARFSREVAPGDEVTLRATWREAGEKEYDCDARLSVAGEPVARVRLSLRRGGDGCSASS